MRKMKYLAAANQIDEYMNTALMGDHRSADYMKIKNLLKIQLLCLELAKCYDSMDDAISDSMRLSDIDGGYTNHNWREWLKNRKYSEHGGDAYHDHSMMGHDFMPAHESHAEVASSPVTTPVKPSLGTGNKPLSGVGR